MRELRKKRGKVPKEENAKLQSIFWGQDRQEIIEYNWWWSKYIEANVTLFCLLNCLAVSIALFVLNEGLTLIFTSVFAFAWCLITFGKIDRLLHFLLVILTTFLIGYLWVRYTLITSVYVQGWLGLTIWVPPCGQSACTKDTTLSSYPTPYNALGYFDQNYPDVESLHLMCPVSDCEWGKPVVDAFDPQRIQGFAELPTGLPDYSTPCNSTNAATCENIPGRRPQDYVDSMGRPIVGIGIADGPVEGRAIYDDNHIQPCNNVNNPPGCEEAILPDASGIVCTQCSSYFARHGLLPAKYACCSDPPLGTCFACPGGLPIFRSQKITTTVLKNISLSILPFFILQLLALLSATANLYVGHREESASKASTDTDDPWKPKEPPRCCRRGYTTIDL